MSKAQKLISGIFALAFALAIAPTASFAATNYDLSVNGEQFTSEKLTIQCGEGTATYDPATQNLTLDNASITNAVDYGGIDSKLTSDLTITLQGEVIKSPSATIWASRPRVVSFSVDRGALPSRSQETRWTA